ncbi:MAG: serine/threonine protein kinase [Clostridia bacterium]|nr:serine/threonine protein kinase [Clostridia bacterium]
MLNPREFCFGCMNRLPELDGKCPHCGRDNHVRKNADDQLPFALLAQKYVIGRSLGRGGFGITYIGLNDRLEMRVAIKEYFPEGLSRRAKDGIHVEPVSVEAGVQMQAGMQKALEEARIIARIQNVPHVVRIYDCFSRNNTVYIVMEYVEGETLSERVCRGGPLSWKEAWALMKPIGQALDILHGRDLIHRDISPDNIMISREDGKSVLLDFGAAGGRIASGEEREKLLKDGYAAPEQYQDHSEIDGRSDEYAWAATLLFAITGHRPDNALQRKFNEGNLLTKKLERKVPRESLIALEKAMAVDPAARFAIMREAVSAMDHVPEKRSLWRTVGWIAAGAAAAVASGSVLIGLLGG